MALGEGLSAHDLCLIADNEFFNLVGKDAVSCMLVSEIKRTVSLTLHSVSVIT